MGDLLAPLKTTRKVKSNVGESETLTLNNGAPSPMEVIEVSSTSRNRASKQSRHKKPGCLATVPGHRETEYANTIGGFGLIH